MAKFGLRWQAGRRIDTRKAFPSRLLPLLVSWYDTRYAAYISKAYPSRFLSILSGAFMAYNRAPGVHLERRRKKITENRNRGILVAKFGLWWQADRPTDITKAFTSRLLSLLVGAFVGTRCTTWHRVLYA